MALENKKTGKLAIGGAVAAVALGLSPVILPAFAAAGLPGISSSANVILDQFTPAGVDSRLAEKFADRQKAAAIRGKAADFQFTPAGLSVGQKTLTIAARSTALQSNAVSVRNTSQALETGRGANRLNKTDFRLTSKNLTAGKGWKAFSLIEDRQAVSATPLITDLGKSNFRLTENIKKKPSRFNTDIAVGKEKKAAPAARGNAAPDDYQVDVGGSYSISRKIDVTAGVRYKSERDRLAPQVDDRSDSEAVYIGTKIRF